MNMKVPLICFLVFRVSLSLLQAQETVVVNDPNARVRDVSSFERISVSSAIKLYLSPDDTEKVVVSANEDWARDKIVTRVRNGVLEIFFDCKGSDCWRGDRRLKVYVGFRNLRELKASGATNTFVNGVIKSDKFRLDVTGASNFKGAIDAGDLEVDQSGASDVRVSGRASSFRVDLSGASSLKGYELSADVIDIDVSGASSAQVNAVKELKVEASGASDVRYRGEGVLKDINTSGASSVKKG
jgi:hypothetical protein